MVFKYVSWINYVGGEAETYNMQSEDWLANQIIYGVREDDVRHKLLKKHKAS
uniref:Uncharacterized protein n=1 Tax=Lepeophtheirus salmonis TaxID=72036 RepID=A0A0K2UX12_LEPSM